MYRIIKKHKSYDNVIKISQRDKIQIKLSNIALQSKYKKIEKWRSLVIIDVASRYERFVFEGTVKKNETLPANHSTIRHRDSSLSAIMP